MKKILLVLFAAFFIGQNIQAQNCDCSPSAWQPFSATFGKLKPITANCGHQFGVKKDRPSKLVGKYKGPENCLVKYSAALRNNVTGTVVQNYPAFTFPWNYTFTIAGNYKLEIIPILGNKKCMPCVFYFTVN
jgi:hypothetical protein